MNKSNFILLIKSLAAKEIHDFDYFIRYRIPKIASPTLDLWKYIKRYIDQENLAKLDREIIFNAVFPHQPFRDATLREHTHYLYKLLKQFMTLKEIQQSDLQSNIHLLRQLRKRSAMRIFEKEYKAIQKTQHQTQQQLEQHHYQQLWLADEANEAFGQQQIRTLDESLPKKLYHLDVWYLLVKLRESCELLNRNNLLNTSYEVILTDSLVKVLEDPNHPYSEIPGIQVWRLIYLMLSSNQEEADTYYAELVHLLASLIEKFNSTDIRGMYQHLQNYCIKQINAGRVRFMEELFLLYKTLIENQLILDNGEISHTNYKNIVTLALRLGHIEWTNSFLYDFHFNISEEFRGNAFEYCLAYFEFETGNKSEAKRLLQNMQFTDVYYEVSARHLLIKIFYAESDWDTLHYFCIAFEGFLKRNKKISQINRTNHLNFLKVFMRLVRYKLKAFDWDQKRKKVKQQQLMTYFNGLSPVSNRKWLVQQIGNLG